MKKSMRFFAIVLSLVLTISVFSLAAATYDEAFMEGEPSYCCSADSCLTSNNIIDTYAGATLIYEYTTYLCYDTFSPTQCCLPQFNAPPAFTDAYLGATLIYEYTTYLCYDCVLLSNSTESMLIEFCEFDGDVISPLSPQAPSVPCCAGHGMDHHSTAIAWFDYNANFHVMQRLDSWTCRRPGCNILTTVQTNTWHPHNFRVVADGGHAAGTNHNWIVRCAQCPRQQTVVLFCPGPPCPSPFSVIIEYDED